MSSSSSTSSAPTAAASAGGAVIPEKGTEELRDWHALSAKDQKNILSFLRTYFPFRDTQLSASAGNVEHRSDEELIALLGQLHLQAVKVFPYKCVQHMSFALPRINHHPLFHSFFLPAASPLREMAAVDLKSLPAAVSKAFTAFESISLPVPLKAVRHADLGCCFGTDLRAIMCSASLSPSQVLGLDVTPDFFALGAQLYADTPLLGSRFGKVDMLDEKSVADCTPLQQFRTEGGIHSLFCGAVYHVFTLDGTIAFTRNIFSILSPGGVLWGYTAGASAAGKGGENGMVTGTVEGSKNRDEAIRYLHSTKSLSKLLKDHGFNDPVVVEQDWRLVLQARQQKQPQEAEAKAKEQEDAKLNDRALLLFAAKKPLVF